MRGNNELVSVKSVSFTHMIFFWAYNYMCEVLWIQQNEISVLHILPYI